MSRPTSQKREKHTSRFRWLWIVAVGLACTSGTAGATRVDPPRPDGPSAASEHDETLELSVFPFASGGAVSACDDVMLEGTIGMPILSATDETECIAGWWPDAADEDSGNGAGTEAFDAPMAWRTDQVAATALDPIAPNPSAGEVRVAFSLARASDVTLTLLDVQGREVAVLASGSMAAGLHFATWGANSRRLSAGIYFARLRAPERTIVRRFVVVAR